MIGVLTLLFSIGFQFHLTLNSIDLKDAIEKGNISKDAQHLFKETIIATDFLSKIVELVTVPTSVALITTGLFMKVDILQKKEQTKYKSDCSNLNNLKKLLNESQNELREKLESNFRGKEIIQDFSKIKALGREIEDFRDEIKAKYSDLNDI